jgi:hypothetical protein
MLKSSHFCLLRSARSRFRRCAVQTETTVGRQPGLPRVKKWRARLPNDVRQVTAGRGNEVLRVIGS